MKKKWWIWVIVAVVVIGLGGILSLFQDGGTQTVALPTVKPLPTVAPSPTPGPGDSKDDPIVVTAEQLWAEYQADESQFKRDSVDKYHNKYIQISGKVLSFSTNNYGDDNLAIYGTSDNNERKFILCWFNNGKEEISGMKQYDEIVILGKGFITNVSTRLLECEIVEIIPAE